jgi:hypothetical protein
MRERWLLPAVVTLVVLPLAVTLLGRALARPSAEPFLEKAAREGCVEDPAWMRAHHMDLLFDLRDQVVRDGVRGERSLEACQECHLHHDRFCDRCHERVGLDPGCFDCHAWPVAEEEP